MVLIFYGLPATGKTELITNLKGFSSVSIDSLIKDKVSSPSIQDFKKYSIELIEEIKVFIDNGRGSHLAIEMGCLTPKSCIMSLEEHLNNEKIPYLNITLIVDDNKLLERIKKRNVQVGLGLSKALTVSISEGLDRFIKIFSCNQPLNSLLIDTTSKTTAEVKSNIQTALKKADGPLVLI